MIQYVKRKDLNVEKYDVCIENSLQSRIYAFSWYLDIVADNWDVLVLDDYKAVMPIPWRKKYFIKYITQPFFCQQLGVFSLQNISEELYLKFRKQIPKRFLRVSLQLNSESYFLSDTITERDNYILALNISEEDLIKNFTTNRKRDLKKAIYGSLTIDKSLSADEFFKFYLLNDKNYHQHKSIKRILYNISQIKNGNVKFCGVRKSGDLIACVLLLIDKKRITYLAPVSNNVGKRNGAATLLVTEIIKTFKNLNYILDFEGSMIKGIASFYRGFGANLEKYGLIKYSKFSFFEKLIKRNAL